MLTRLKVLTVWLLALAMPVQGLAAAGMTHCGSSHEGGHAAVAQAHHPAAAADTAHPHPAQPAQTDTQTDLAPCKCAACGACCSAFGLPALALTVPEELPVADWQAEPVQGRVGFLTSGPDRPPRPSLA